MGLGGTHRAHRGGGRRIVIKQSNAAQKSKNQIPHVIPPYHTTPKKNQNNQNTGSIPGNVPHWAGRWGDAAPYGFTLLYK